MRKRRLLSASFFLVSQRTPRQAGPILFHFILFFPSAFQLLCWSSCFTLLSPWPSVTHSPSCHGVDHMEVLKFVLGISPSVAGCSYPSQAVELVLGYIICHKSSSHCCLWGRYRGEESSQQNQYHNSAAACDSELNGFEERCWWGCCVFLVHVVACFSSKELDIHLKQESSSSTKNTVQDQSAVVVPSATNKGGLLWYAGLVAAS